MINLLELVLDEVMRTKGEKLSFVQIGAHDGVHYDPVRPFIDRFHWAGILVEPQPEIFKRLVANYAGELQLKFENKAIAAHNGTLSLYAFKKPQAFPDHATMLVSHLEHAVSQNSHGYRGETERIEFPCITLKELFKTHGIQELDFLQIDTEGYDYEILKMLQKEEIRPTAINFESAFYNQFELQGCYDMLRRMGYRVLPCGIDTVAYRQVDKYPRKEYPN